MTGLLLIVVFIVWLMLVVTITRVTVKGIRSNSLKNIARIFLVFVLMVTPLSDEIVGGFHFWSLCRERAVVNIDINKAEGKVVRLRVGRNPNYSQYTQIPTHKIKYSLVPITETNYEYYDIETREVVLSYKTLSAEGGWLIRALGISGSNSPLLFTKFCAPADRFSIFDKYNIKKED